MEVFTCGTGLIDYELKPGEIKSLRVKGVSLFWKQGQDIQFGFPFWHGFMVKNQTFWSENLPTTDSIEGKLLEEQKGRN